MKDFNLSFSLPGDGEKCQSYIKVEGPEDSIKELFKILFPIIKEFRKKEVEKMPAYVPTPCDCGDNK